MKRRVFHIELEIDDMTVWQGLDALGLRALLENRLSNQGLRVCRSEVTEVE